MRQSDIDLMRRIHSGVNHILLLPIGKTSEYDEDLRYLEDHGFVRLATGIRLYPDQRVYSLTHEGLEAIEEADNLASKEAEEKKDRANDRKTTIWVAALSYVFGIVTAYLPQIIAFFRSLFHR